MPSVPSATRPSQGREVVEFQSRQRVASSRPTGQIPCDRFVFRSQSATIVTQPTSRPAAAPAITAPVSRHLDVADVVRSVAFYRDAIGFDVQSLRAGERVELTLGPARLTLGRRPAGAAPTHRSILFFETADVAATYDILAARGANPTVPEDVNWIKMRMIEIRDPDGNTLWFGNGFGGANIARPRHLLRQVMPEMPCHDVSAAVAFYRDTLGFEVNYQQHDLGVMDRDGLRVLLIARTRKHTGIGSCYFYVTDADALHAELTAKQANVQGEPVSQPWGLREFSVLDLDGNRLSFGQTFE
jgi:catechol 2,3-dioxygenase-like lactoylglutathione lyase family enzyme